MRFPAHCVRFSFALILSLCVSACVTTHHRTQTQLTRAESKAPTILVLPVDAELSELSFGGFSAPRQDWSAAARDHMNSAIRKTLADKSIGVYFPGDQLDDEVSAKVMRLHASVGHSIMRHQYDGLDRLPTKADSFQWTLGPDARRIARTDNADYMLMIHVRDSYSGPGRVVAQVVVAALFGVGMQGGVQAGFASLVDLKSGDVVWFNRLMRGAGDLRTEVPARETVEMLLTGMPQ